MSKTKITFSNDIEVAFVNKLRERVKNYFDENKIVRYGNAGMVIKSIFMFSLYLAPYLLMMTGVISGTLGIALCYVSMGFGAAGIGLSVMHDANHRSYSKNQKVNNLLSYSLELLGGSHKTWRYQHNVLHHRYTNIEGYDEDIDPGNIMRFSPNSELRKLHRYQHIYAWFLYGLMTLTWTIDKDFKQVYRYLKEGVELEKGRSKASIWTELILVKLVYYTYILVLPIIFLPIPWWTAILFYLLMHFISGFLLAVVFQTAHVVPSSDYPLPEDSGKIEQNWNIHQLLTTSNYAPKNRLLTWFVGSLNYQVEHHLFPSICHIHYRKLSPIVQQTAKEFNLPYHVQPSFIAAIGAHQKMMKKLGRE